MQVQCGGWGGVAETSGGLEEVFISQRNKNKIAARAVAVMCLSHFRETAKSLSSSLPTWTEPAFLHAHTRTHTQLQEEKIQTIAKPQDLSAESEEGEEAWKDTPLASLSHGDFPELGGR